MAFESRVLAALDQAYLSAKQRKPVDPYDSARPRVELANRGNPVVNKPRCSSNNAENSTENPTGETSNRNAAAKKPASQNQKSKLTKYSYKDYKPTPTIVYTQSEDEADELVQIMKGPLGFDMEWKCIFCHGAYQSRKTGLIQISDDNIILLVQLSAMKKFPPGVKKVIESPDIIKLGVNIRGDGEKLFNDYGIFASNLVELGGVANQADFTFSRKYKRSMVALAKMVEFYEQKLLPKGSVRMSNWEASPLNEEQLEYAANDAHCALMMYKKIKAAAELNERTLEPEKYTTDLRVKYKSGELCLTLPRPYPGAKEPEKVEPSPQHKRSYLMWHSRGRLLADICATLRTKENPLKESTVISYIIRALQADETLPYDMDRLKDLIYQDLGSWSRHGAWLLDLEKKSL